MAVSGSASSKGKSASTASVIAKEPGELTIPIRQIDVVESMALGFRQLLVSLGDDEDGGEVATGGGLGTDFIQLKWGDKMAMVRGSELLKAWVATFAPEDAKRFPKEVR